MSTPETTKPTTGHEHGPDCVRILWGLVDELRAQQDVVTAERDEARAEVARLRAGQAPVDVRPIEEWGNVTLVPANAAEQPRTGARSDEQGSAGDTRPASTFEVSDFDPEPGVVRKVRRVAVSDDEGGEGL